MDNLNANLGVHCITLGNGRAG